ncbi:MAG: hypothetical protein ABIQ73_16900 [Acidimicrobiales bacterium]
MAAAGLVFAGACGDDRPTLTPASSAASIVSTATTAAVTTTLSPATTASPSGPTTSLGAAPPELDMPKLTDTSAVTTAGIGPLTFGMTVALAQPAIGTRLLTESGRAPSGECYYVKPERGPAGLFMMVSKSTIERIDIKSGNVKTRSGLGVGTTLDQLKTALKEQLQINGNTAVFVPTSANDANYRVIFETDGTTVTSYRSGKVPEVTNAVGCA